MSDTSTSSTYTIQPGDCLSALAKKWHTTVEKLIELNRWHILNPDEIYVGQTIQVPQPIKLTEAGSQSLPKRPALDTKTRLCAPKHYVDIVFVPRHPKKQAPAWLLLTAKAKAAFDQEAQRLDNAITPLANTADANHASALKQSLEAINQLGLLEPFKGAEHAVFLAPDVQKVYEEAQANKVAVSAVLEGIKYKWTAGLTTEMREQLNQELTAKQYITLKQPDPEKDLVSLIAKAIVPVTAVYGFEAGGIAPPLEVTEYQDAVTTCEVFVQKKVDELQQKVDEWNQKIKGWNASAERIATRKGFEWDAHIGAYAETTEVQANEILQQIQTARAHVLNHVYQPADGARFMQYWDAG